MIYYFSLSPAVTEPIYGGQLARDYLEKRVNPVLVQGLTELCKQKPEDAVVCSISLQPFSHVLSCKTNSICHIHLHAYMYTIYIYIQV